MSRNAKENLALATVAAVIAATGLAMIAWLSHELVGCKKRAPKPPDYMPGKGFLALSSFGHRKVVADAIWIQTIQYFNEETKKPRNRAMLKGPMLGPRLEAITYLDPHFHGAYQFGSLFMRIFRRHDENLEILAQGERRNPGMSFYPSEIGNVYYFELREFDKAMEAYLRALKCDDIDLLLEKFVQALLARKGEFDSMIRYFIDRYEKSRSDDEKADIEEKIRSAFATLLPMAVKSELDKQDRTTMPLPEAIPSLPAVAGARLTFAGYFGEFAVYRTPPFSAGPVAMFRDLVLYRPSTTDVMSLYQVKKNDRIAKENIAAAVAAFIAAEHLPPPPGAEGIRDLLEKGIVRRFPQHPLGGGYVLDRGSNPLSEKGWESFIADLERELPLESGTR